MTRKLQLFYQKFSNQGNWLFVIQKHLDQSGCEKVFFLDMTSLQECTDAMLE